jgi:hypothetical protein
LQNLEANKLQNYGVTIYLNDNEEIDLKNILQVIGETGRQSDWKISDVECSGENAEIIHQISDVQEIISGKQFYTIIQDINQTIDGVFEAYRPNKTLNWLLIRAVDGTEFDIETEDLEIMKRIRYSFHNVKDLEVS